MSVFLDIASLLDFLSPVIVKNTLICKKFSESSAPYTPDPYLVLSAVDGEQAGSCPHSKESPATALL